MEVLRLLEWRGNSLKAVIFNLCFSSLFVIVGTIVVTNQTPQPMSDDTAISLSEDTRIGTVIGNISAFDADGPQPVTFSIPDKLTSKLVELKNYREMGPGSHTWAMDIVLKDQLDRDYQPSIRKLTFTATDGKSEIALEVSLMIQDVNDVKPLLLNLPYKVTIPENQDVDSIVFPNVSALDPDNGRGSTVEYSLTTDAQGANDEYRSTFEISSTNGKIFLKKKLDYEKRSFYIFKVGVKDKGEPVALEGDPADFVVTVLDVQDTPPMFVNLPYSTEINEDGAVGTSVLRVTGIDGDQGIPNELSYSFVSGDHQNFDINEKTGWITVKSALDRDSPSMADNGGVYAMWVQATEIDVPGRPNYGNTTAKAIVTISVQDVNDNGPKFSESHYTAEILENMKDGVPVTFLGPGMRVFDKDQGTNSHFSLSVEKEGQPYPDFTTLPGKVYTENTVLIRVRNSKALDYEKEKQLVFQVVAREIDTAEKRSSTATVTLNVLDMNDNDPRFEESKYLFPVQENASVGQSIGAILATDDDTGSYGNVSYSLRGDNEKFQVHSQTGILSVKGSLDRETTSHYYLSAEAMDGGGNRAATEIEVVVQDINDNAPLFRRRDYEGVVQEKSASFLRPIVVEALDDDEPMTNNSQVYYRIDSTPTSLETNFFIDPSTGEISLTRPLDYESLNPALGGKVVLKVSALDMGQPQKSSATFVNITVEDVNDFPPVFGDPSYSKNIPENSPQDTLVLTVSASDNDGTNPNNDFFYRIESGALDKFRINFDTGEIFVESGAKLDREEKKEYLLRVSATDRGNPPLTGSSSVIIVLDNVNDEMPRFAASSDMVTVSENLGVGRSVFAYVATDSDDDSNLRYSLLKDRIEAYSESGKTVDAAASGVNNYFDVHDYNGTIYVSSQLDRETAEKIVVQILAEDLNAATPPQQSSTATLTITLSDYNDNPPKFVSEFEPSNEYRVNVSEAQNVNTVILRVSATDADRGQTVTYQMDSSGAGDESSFSVVGETVVLQHRLDRETQPSHTFTIVAKDSGDPQLSSTATVFITVTDENDQIPKFEDYPKVFQVPEDADVGYEVYVLTANDADAGDFGEVVYSLEGVDSGDGKFSIDADSGRLTVAQSLDREQKQEYRLEVKAEDKDPDRVNRKSSRAPLTIRVGDVNDNRPQFQPLGSASPTVAEIAEPGKSLFTIIATDEDEGENGTVEYRLTSDTNATVSGSNLFSIEASTGIVRVAQALLRKAGVYYVTVEASDKGKQKLSNTERFTINVYDVNDVYPFFVDPDPDNAVVYISEGAPPGSVVHRLRAEDTDTGRNGLVAYSLDPQQDRVILDTFQMNATSGDLTIRKRLDREIRSQYQVKVRATDHGIPRNFSTELTLEVRVRDVNDEPPKFDRRTLPTPYVVKLKENDTDQDCVSVGVAVDGDSEADFTTICYYLKGTELDDTFRLDTSGSLCLQKDRMLDQEVTPFINLVVRASDNCNEDVSTAVMTPSNNNSPEQYRAEDESLLWVKVNVTDVNDNRPVFVRHDLALGITRDVQVGKIIYNLKDEANDKDTDKWGVSHFVNLTAFQAYPAQLARELQDLRVTAPFRLFPNGSVQVNTYFNADMSGYFIVSVRVLDKGGLSDDAELRISLISDSQRLKVVFREGVAQVGSYRAAFAQRMSAVTNYRIVVDKVQTHENEKGVAESDKTDVFIHGEDKTTNEIIPAVTLLQAIDELSAEVAMIRLLNDFNVLEIVETKSMTKDDELEKQLQMALILVSVILGVLCIILAVALFLTYRRYTRKLKAATALAYGSQETDLYKVDLPGTNMHAYENSNPIYLEKIMLEGDDDGQNSLDQNGVGSSSSSSSNAGKSRRRRSVVGGYDEQEVCMNIIPESGVRTQHHQRNGVNKAGYLKAVISEHDTSTNLQANHLAKAAVSDKMGMAPSSSPNTTPSSSGTSSRNSSGVNEEVRAGCGRRGDRGVYVLPPDVRPIVLGGAGTTARILRYDDDFVTCEVNGLPSTEI
ncbi:cadherin-23-like isoform X3 [Babylonia areolata]|uniref:cadherin-23-like isoform X3 n=1 Tax=Babylonia areolata TaxID=304850 RepID=UPI003FD1549E